mgnify:CR=1 FL=1
MKTNFGSSAYQFSLCLACVICMIYIRGRGRRGGKINKDDFLILLLSVIVNLSLIMA